MLSRRGFVRFAVGGACAGAVSGTGCLGQDTTVVDQNSSGRVTDVRDDRLTREEFGDYVEEIRETYGDNCVWGSEGGAPQNLEYVGAWTRRSPIMNGSGMNDSAVAVYKTGRRTEAGESDESYAFWLWNAARSELPDGVDGGVKRLYTGARFGTGYEMVVYSPGGDQTGDEYTVNLGFPGIETPTATVPLNGGTVSPVGGKTSVGGGGSYRAEWKHETGVQVASVCSALEARWSEDEEYDFDWDNGYSATAMLEDEG